MPGTGEEELYGTVLTKDSVRSVQRRKHLGYRGDIRRKRQDCYPMNPESPKKSGYKYHGKKQSYLIAPLR